MVLWNSHSRALRLSYMGTTPSELELEEENQLYIEFENFADSFAKSMTHAITGEKNVLECPICYQIMEDETQTVCSCNHKFHTKCLQTWYEVSATKTCPVCRQDTCFSHVSSDEEVESIRPDAIVDKHDSDILSELQQTKKCSKLGYNDCSNSFQNKKACKWNYKSKQCNIDEIALKSMQNALLYPLTDGRLPNGEVCPESHPYERIAFNISFCSDEPPVLTKFDILNMSDLLFAPLGRIPYIWQTGNEFYTSFKESPRKTLKELFSSVAEGAMSVIVTTMIRLSCIYMLSPMDILSHFRIPSASLEGVGNAFFKEIGAMCGSLVAMRGIPPRLVMGTIGAGEEGLFRETMPKLLEKLRPKIEKILDKISSYFFDKEKPKTKAHTIKTMYTILSCLVCGISFGLFHVSNLLFMENNAQNKISVYCQVVFTAIWGTFLNYMRARKGLSNIGSFTNHFVHNFVVIGSEL